MGFNTQLPSHVKPSMQQQAQQLFNDNQQRTQVLSKSLLSNRDLLAKVVQYGFAKL